MQGQGTTPVGPDPYARPPQLPHAYQHGQPSFRPASSITGYQHAPPNFLQPGPPASVVSGGLGSAQSYMHHHLPPHINSQTSHFHPTYEKQPLPWSRNMQQLPPAAPFQGPNAYLPPSSQGRAFGRGPSHLPPSHTPPTSYPPYQPSSSALISDTFDSSVLPIGERSSQLRPVHPPLPPPPSSSPPGVPPIPPSSPPSDIIPKRDGDRNLEGLFDKNNLMIESASSLNAVEERGVYETSVPFQHSEKSGTEEGSVDAVVANSPPDSDMDMEDDITHPDAYASKCQEGQAKDQLQPSQPAGGHSLSEHGNILLSGASVTEFEREGSKIAPLPVSMKVTSETDDLGMSENGQTEYFSDVSVEDSSTRHKNLRQPSLTEPFSRTANEKLSDQGLEGANSFKLIQGYGSDNTSENDQGNLPMNVGSCTANDGSTNFDVEKGCNFGTELRHENQTGSNARILSESQRNDMQTDKLSALTPIIANDSGRRRRGLESVIISAVSSEPKDLRNDHDITEGENLHKADVRSSSSKLNVDEFGRLVREGVSDSDTSDSSHYARRHLRRTRKRSRSRSKSQSPHNRRRRRSPWRRKERRSRSRSLSPKKRRSKSRSPGMRRDSNFGGDKLRLNKGQVAICFDFLRGKCYRGATCRYSHHESNKSERSRYNRDKQHYRDGSRSRQSPDFREESKVILDKEMKDRDFPPGSREAKGVKRLEVDSSTDSPSVLGNLGSGSLLVTDAAASNHSHYSAHAIPSGKDKSLVLESAVQYPNEIPQSVYQQGDRTNDTPVSESSAQAISATSTDPIRNSDVKQGPIAQLSSIGAPVTKPYSTDEVSSQSLKDMLPSIANHPSYVSTPLPSALQTVRASFAQPLVQEYGSKPPISWMHTMPDNNPTYQAPVAYQHPHFHGLSKSLSSSFIPLPLPPPPAPPPPPPPPQSTGEHGISSQHMQQSKLAPWSGLSSYTSMMARPNELPYRSQTCQYQTNNLGREPDQVVHSANSFGSSNFHASNMMTQQGGPRRMLEDGSSGHPVQGINPLLPQAQPNSLMVRSPLKGTHNSVAGGLPSDGSSEYRPYFQQSSYGMQHSVAGHVPASHAETGMFSSSTSRITPDFPETNHPSYAHNFVESRTSSYPNSYASTFDLPPSSKFSSNASIQDNNTTINTKYGALVGMSVAAVDVQKIAIDSSKNKSDLPGAGGDQYDPLFDCIEPASNMFSKADHKKYETTAELDDLVGFSGSGRVLNMEGKKQESGSSVSAHDSLENEEFGETADVAVDAVLNGTPSNPNYATDMTAGEVEIDQVKTSGKKKKNKERSMKLFKISIAAFVKEVLKPSWRQGNMSKEAFKTIVKKTVDKVSGAMKSHQIPKSQTKINHYIDSSRGKLTKLVMGYVDKYVKA